MSAEGRVENQKLNQTAALLSFGWVFGFQLDLLEKYLVSLSGFTSTKLFIYNFKIQKFNTLIHMENGKNIGQN